MTYQELRDKQDYEELKQFIKTSCVVCFLFVVAFFLFNLARGFPVDKYAPDNPKLKESK